MLCESFPEFADCIQRNLAQSDRGGHDLIGLPYYAIEVKNVEQFSLPKFWGQTVVQAQRAFAIPVLARKVRLHGWRVYMAIPHIANPAAFGCVALDPADLDAVAEITYPAFVRLARSFLMIIPPSEPTTITTTHIEADSVRS